MTFEENVLTIDGKEYRYHKVDNDVNGNPRYVLHFLQFDIDMDDYGKIPGFKKYRAKWFGGGYVFTTYNLEETIRHYQSVADDHNQAKEDQ